ncbi:MAG: U32 family peptidase [Gammaproteobacteria bacterium]|nr:MAG: U32 family peptidase [Gammaproteobacteria bacterium]
MKIVLAPIPFFWPKHKVLSYYDRVADWPVDRVFLGETVCSKRREMRLNDWLAIAEKLADKGKEVVLSTLALVESRAEVGQIRQIVETGLPIEANDWTAVDIAVTHDRPFYAGPSINIYNNGMLHELKRLGLVGWTLPVELGKHHLQRFQHDPETPLQVIGFGFAPLAYSARCFTARAANVGKDACELRCQQHEQGLVLTSQEQQPIFRLNGIQTLSAQCIDLARYWQEMKAHGVDEFRYIPTDDDDGDRIQALYSAIQEKRQVTWSLPWPKATGYWFSLPGMCDAEERLAISQ